jgi:NAD(P)-dependent dehydrogenase (short-subunit alcohol dehydrogenase family)
MRVEGSSVLVTGAASGIGEQAVLHFLSAGAKVTVWTLIIRRF